MTMINENNSSPAISRASLSSPTSKDAGGPTLGR